MSHLIQEYAKNLGVLANQKPIIFEHYWPISFNKYIIVNTGAEVQSKIYKHFNLVLDMLSPVLKKNNISVIQLGSQKDQKLENVSLRLCDLNHRQIAYIISRSCLYLGSDCVWSHYANSKNIPIVTLHGNAYASISNGFWSNNQINLEAPWSVCPNFSSIDSEFSINKIKPEQIAASCCNLLNISYKNSLCTEYIGKLFGEPIVEIIPDFLPKQRYETHSYFLRSDYFGDDFLPYWCDAIQNFSIFITSTTDINILARFSHKISSILLDVSNNESSLPSLVPKLIEICPRTVLLAENDILAKARNQWFDFKVLPKKPQDLPILDGSKKLFIASSKIVLDSQGEYPSLFHRKNGLKNQNSLMKFPIDPDFMNEIEHFSVFSKIS